MNIDQLNTQFANKTICRCFIEAARWPSPHYSLNVSYKIKVSGSYRDRYECKRC